MTERPNIRRMQVPESSDAAQLEFDPKRDILPQDWKQVEQLLAKFRADDALVDFVSLAGQIKNVDGTRTIQISDEEWKRIMQKSATLDGGYNWTSLDLARSIKTLRPGTAGFEKRRTGWRKYLDEQKNWQLKIRK